MAPSGLPFNLDTTLGAAFLGGIFAAILYGMTNMQIFIYYHGSGRDMWPMKVLVAFLWSLDSLHLALIVHALYFYLVTSFADPVAIASPTWSVVAQIIVTSISDAAVRCVFARRVWALSRRNWFLTLTTLALTFVVLAGGLGFAIKCFSLHSFTEFSTISWLLYTALGLIVVADVFVAVCLCFLLNKSRTGFKKTDSLVKLLMLYCINTGLLTSLCAICCFVAYASMPDNFIYIGFYFILSKLYLNSLLATLNARDGLREKAGLVSIGMSNVGSSTGQHFISSDRTFEKPDTFQHLAVTVETVTDVRVESGGDIESVEHSPYGSRAGDMFPHDGSSRAF